MKSYRVPQTAQQYTHYDMIQRHTELPPFADARGALLYAFVSCGSRVPSTNREELAELYALVTGLVQLGLDTHEEIERPALGSGEEAMRSRQLKVLAGDYFSSWFYRLLAEKGEIERVGSLSEAIAEYNVKKAELYGEGSRAPEGEARMEMLAELNTVLFRSFTPLIGASYQELWLSLLRELGLYEALAWEERNKTEPDAGDEMRERLSDKLRESRERIAARVAGVREEALRSALELALGAWIAQPARTEQASGEA
ncbi:heptaprenyl diphosphate synthase component 1 [Paenibacillus glufosinatiresistens]|uniref:heptaprenyl diphosphate synthase component 1 n=1 Tax=Paenibacillus glufosinatiresistens TaxID=3070657 RepID=UPI00286E3794|nr:heptaprenyl diphosphate synthase component 1 [Paenibacillus sp. YX.27]